LTSRYEQAVYSMLFDEPATPREVAKKLGVNFKTAKDVHYKASGRIHIFWRGE